MFNIQLLFNFIWRAIYSQILLEKSNNYQYLMNKAFNSCQSYLKQLQIVTQEKLLCIQQLDKQCLSIEIKLDQMRQTYLSELQKEDSQTQHSLQTQQNQLSRISALEEDLKQLSQKKIIISEEIQKLVQETCGQINQKIISSAKIIYGKSTLAQQIEQCVLYSFGLKKQKGRQKLINPKIQLMAKQYFDIQKVETQINKKYCVCTPDKVLLYSNYMIECQNSKCPINWFHFECVGINSDNVPDSWLCSACSKNLKTIKKLKQAKSLSKEKQPNKIATNIEEKRGRGRPKKYEKQEY